MNTPHYLLFADAESHANYGRWRFVLESILGGDALQVDDVESDIQGERLELLAVIRGLEALEQPSRVMLVTPSRYVRRGLRFGLENWRESGWRWERHGELVPIKNADLWQRLDQALRIHTVKTRHWRWDANHDAAVTYEVDRYGADGLATDEEMLTAIPA